MTSLRLKILPRLPVAVQGANGIAASVSSGIMTIEPSWEDLALLTSPDNPVNKEVWVRDPDTGVYNRVALQAISGRIMGDARRTVTTGTVTIDAVNDDLVIVAMSPAAAVNVNFPTAAARIAANDRWIGVKNNHANPALYPLQPVRSGSDTIDDSATPLPQDTNRVRWYKPTAANDWEIQNG